MYFMRLWAEIFPDIKGFTNKNYYYYQYDTCMYCRWVCVWVYVTEADVEMSA